MRPHADERALARMTRAPAPRAHAPRARVAAHTPVCETEKVIHSLAYEPGFEPFVASVHALHPRERAAVDVLDRAA